MGAKFAFQALVELVDTGVSRAEQKALGQIVMSVDGVHGFRRLRTRLMGGQVVMDVCILLDGDLTLNDADRLARRVRRRLLRSEEHTSELQSRGHLVCRLLLEEE